LSDQSRTPVRGGLGFIRNPRDFWGGVGVIAFACIAWWASSNLPGQQGFAFGPGTAPRLFIFLTGALGVLIVAVGLFTDGPGLERWSLRGPMIVLGAILIFASMIRPLGLIISTFSLVVISSLGSKDSKLLEAVIWGVVLSVFCALLFPYGLNLPMQLWPRF
jgi:putative tricarboxylic transport membrane protein